MSAIFRPNCLKCSLLAFILLLFQPAFSQSAFDAMDAGLKGRQKALGTDFVVVLWKGDTVVHKKEMGEFNSKTQVSIGNASKWLTAALVMELIDEGKLSLDDKVSRWLPEFEKYGKNYISIRYCLDHMTGIEDEGKALKKLFQKKKFTSLEDEVNSFAAREIRANPGTDFWFGNIGLSIAGRVLEIVSKKRFDQLAKQKLFTPLTMRKSSFTNPDGGAVDPSAGAVSTADDYIKFLGMLLNKGKYMGKQILSEESVNQLLTLQTKPELIKNAPKTMEGYGYALGSWVMGEGNGATQYTSAEPNGTWPILDLCRGYALLLFVKEAGGDDKKAAVLQMKSQADEAIGDCK